MNERQDEKETTFRNPYCKCTEMRAPTHWRMYQGQILTHLQLILALGCDLGCGMKQRTLCINW